MTTAHELSHTIATIKYRDKLIGTANGRDLDPEKVKYTIALNKDKTRAWHFWTSKDIFYKWEAEYLAPRPECVDLEITNKNGEWLNKAVYKAEVVKDK